MPLFGATFTAQAGPSRRAFNYPTGFRHGPAAFVGVGDVLSSANGFWGVRTYNLASVGNNLLTVQRSSDATSKTFTSLSSGGFNTSDAFFDGSTYTVTKLFDTTGNGNDATGTVGLNLTGAPNGGPILSFSGTQHFSITSLAMAATSSTACVFKATSGARANIAGFNNGTSQLIADYPGINQVTAYGNLAAAAADNTWHSFLALFAGASGSVWIDTAQTTGTATAAGTGPGYIGSDNGGGSFAAGLLLGEVGLWSGIDITSVMAAMNTNQHTYYGF